MSNSCVRYILAIVAMLSGLQLAEGHTFHSFLMPYEIVSLSASEIGEIAVIHVHEGDTVSEGDVLVEIDCSVLQATRRTAETRLKSKAKLKAAETAVQLKQRRYEALLHLKDEGHENPEEFLRAVAELEIAKLEVESIKDAMAVAQMELSEIDARIARHRIVARGSGVVSQLTLEVGEHVLPSNPQVLTLENTNRLKATFFLPKSLGWTLDVDQPVMLTADGNADTIEGEVRYVSYSAIPETGSVKVMIEIDNSDHRLHAGVPCCLTLENLEGVQ